jgi:hypothetical protein
MTTTSHTLYRFFDMRGSLLYVGRTINPGRRWREHEKDKPWFNEVATLTRQVYATAEAVDQAERDAIATESPRYNIALNPRRVASTRPRVVLPPVQSSDDTWPADLRTRWAAAQIEPVLECEGDVTFCECSSCHDGRMGSIEELRDSVGIHPDIRSQIEALERSYFAGDDVSDWYYDLQDTLIFGRWTLAELSRKSPYPAYAEIEPGPVAVVWCPFCSSNHRHLLEAHALLDTPLTAGCDPSTGGRYLLMTDLADQFDLERRWGAQYEQAVVAS